MDEDARKKKIPWKLFIGIILSVWLLKTFCAESFRIPSNQMESSLLDGDHLWVWKGSYGVRLPQTPLSLPFFYDTVPGVKCRSYLPLGIPEIRFFQKSPSRNDIVVFNIPSLKDGKNIPADRKPVTVARCVGLPGDTLALENGVLRVNGDIVAQSPRATHAYYYPDSVRGIIDSLFLKLKITVPVAAKEGHNNLCFLTRYNYFRIKNMLPESDMLKGIYLGRNNCKIVLPRINGETPIDSENAESMAALINAYEGKSVQFRNGRIYDADKEISSFRFSQPYYWVLADNREMGIDSRRFGILPHSHLIGKGGRVWLSFDPEKPFYRSFRPERMFKIF